MRPEGWLCYSIGALLQSVHGWHCRQITDRESQREGKKQRKETQRDAVKAYHKSCLRHWELLICPNCHGWLHLKTFVCRRKKRKCIWNPCDTQYIVVGKRFAFFFSLLSLLLSQWRVFAVSLAYVYRAVLNSIGDEATGEIGLSGSIIAAINATSPTPAAAALIIRAGEANWLLNRFWVLAPVEMSCQNSIEAKLNGLRYCFILFHFFCLCKLFTSNGRWLNFDIAEACHS